MGKYRRNRPWDAGTVNLRFNVCSKSEDSRKRRTSTDNPFTSRAEIQPLRDSLNQGAFGYTGGDASPNGEGSASATQSTPQRKPSSLPASAK